MAVDFLSKIPEAQEDSDNLKPLFVFQMNSLGNPHFTLRKPISILVETDGDGSYVLFWLEANLGTGDNVLSCAILALQDYIMQTHVKLTRMSDDKLGPAMLSKKYVLKDCINWDFVIPETMIQHGGDNQE